MAGPSRASPALQVRQCDRLVIHIIAGDGPGPGDPQARRGISPSAPVYSHSLTARLRST